MLSQSGQTGSGQTGSGQTRSVWMITSSLEQPLPLTQDERADVCIIGAGIAGLTAAYLLTKAGKRVVVLDDGPIGGGESCRTTAHLSNVIDDRYTRIERVHGLENSRLACEAHTSAIHRIGLICQEEGIDCGFERLDGYLFAGPDHDVEFLQAELQAAQRAGLVQAAFVSRAPGGFDTGPCIRFPEQGQFHPLKYMLGLAGAIRSGGGRLLMGHAKADIKGGDRIEVSTREGHVIDAGHVLVMTNSPVTDRVRIHTKQAPYRTYAVAARIDPSVMPHMLLWDTMDPYHYVRLQRGADGQDWLIVGGEDHKTGQDAQPQIHWQRLEEWTRQRFAIGQIDARWSGQVMETIDGLAFIGPDPSGERNVYIATGDSGMGMTHGTIAGVLLTDLVMGRQSPWSAVFDPSRKRTGAAGEFVKENVNVAGQYMDWASGSEVDTVDQIAPQSGAVIRRGIRKVAVYRDADNRLHEFSASCPHLGCVVSWNKAEGTWDCPCHGSRFEATGQVINGPANANLSEETSQSQRQRESA